MKSRETRSLPRGAVFYCCSPASATNKLRLRSGWGKRVAVQIAFVSQLLERCEAYCFVESPRNAFSNALPLPDRNTRWRVMMKNVQRIVAVCVTVLVPFQLLADSKPERIYRKVLPSVMTLEVENFAGERFVGSAVLSLDDDIAITAWHVVSDACSVRAVFADGSRVKVEGCVNIDRNRDLALLKLEKPLPGRRAVLSPRLQAIATRVFVIGAPKGYGFSISDGLVSQLRDVDGITQYQISCPISPGNSGGPLLNERGEVVGITSWTKSDAQNLSFAIPSREIERLKTRGPVITWQKLALDIRSRTAPQEAISKAAVKDDTMPGFDDFAKRLERSTGRRVTVVVQEDGKENAYTFTVPRSAFK